MVCPASSLKGDIRFLLESELLYSMEGVDGIVKGCELRRAVDAVLC